MFYFTNQHFICTVSVIWEPGILSSLICIRCIAITTLYYRTGKYYRVQIKKKVCIYILEIHTHENTFTINTLDSQSDPKFDLSFFAYIRLFIAFLIELKYFQENNFRFQFLKLQVQGDSAFSSGLLKSFLSQRWHVQWGRLKPKNH